MITKGFVKLFRNDMQRIGYNNVTDVRVYLHLMLNANPFVNVVDGCKIKRGEIITSFQSISSALSISIAKVRTAVQHLQDMDLIAWIGVRNKYSICKITDYKKQGSNDNYGYVQIYRKIQQERIYQKENAIIIYLYLLLNADYKTGVITTSRKEIMDITGLSDKVVRYAINTIPQIMIKKDKQRYVIKISDYPRQKKRKSNNNGTQKNKEKTEKNLMQNAENGYDI